LPQGLRAAHRNKLSIFNTFRLPFCATRSIGGHFYCAKDLTLHSSKARERRAIRGLRQSGAVRAWSYARVDLNAVHADFGELPIDMPQRR